MPTWLFFSVVVSLFASYLIGRWAGYLSGYEDGHIEGRLDAEGREEPEAWEASEFGAPPHG